MKIFGSDEKTKKGRKDEGPERAGGKNAAGSGESSPGGGGSSQSIIAADLTVDGSIERADRIRIDGRVTGDVSATSELVVGEHGRVEGKLSAPRIVIVGSVDGEPNAAEELVLKKTARLTGDAAAPVVVIESGASVKGEVRTGDFFEKE